MMYYPRTTGRAYCGESDNTHAYCGPNTIIASPTWATEQANNFDVRVFGNFTDSRGQCPSPSPVVVTGVSTADVCRLAAGGVTCKKPTDCCSNTCAPKGVGQGTVCGAYSPPNTTLPPTFTQFPTNIPTFPPSLAPTSVPTRTPTTSPTAAPTWAPTPNLTTSNSWYFNVNLQVVGVTPDQWNTATANALRQALGTALNISPARIVLVDVEPDPSNSSVILVSTQIFAGTNSEGSALVPLLNTSIDLTNATHSQIPAVTHASVTNVSALIAPSTPPPSLSPTPAPPKPEAKSSNSTAVGLGVGLGIGLTVLLVFMLFCYRKASNRGQNEKDVKQWKTQQDGTKKKKPNEHVSI
jgi:hypothetical protein